MKLQCTTDKITIAVSKTEKITGKNLNLPILSCILLEAKQDNLIIKSTNLDLGIEIIIKAKIEEEGIVAVSGNVLKNLLSNISNKNNLFLESTNNNLLVLSDNTKTIIKSQPYNDFPSIPKIKGQKSFIIDCKKIIKGLRSVWYSASVSSIKPELSSVLINIDMGYLYFVATDSFRLAEIKIPIKTKEEIKNILIPFKNIPEIIRVFEDMEGDVEIEFTKNQISFKCGNIYLTSRIVDGVFPDYKQFIPKEFTTEVVVLLNDLVNVFKITNIFSDKFNQINFKISPQNKKFEIKSKNSEIGESVNTIPASLSGDDLEINFNCKYITDCFQSITADSIIIQFNGLNKPMIIRGVSDNQFLYLVMSMNK